MLRREETLGGPGSMPLRPPDQTARITSYNVCYTKLLRETGVIPAALAGLLGALGAPGADLIAAITFVAILTTILVQAPSTRWLAAKLGVLEQPRELSGLSL